MQPTYNILFEVVDDGIVTPIAVYVPFQLKERDVPLSSILIISLLPSTGEPIGALIVNVWASAVTLY